MQRATSVLVVLLASIATAQTQKPPQPVQVSAQLGKPDADGRQLLTVKITVEKGWHIYANPAGASGPMPTTIKVEAATPLRDVQVEYPPGKALAQAGETFRVYEDTVVIPVRIQRAVTNGQPDTSPLTVTIRYQACNEQVCLPPRTIQLSFAP